MEGEALSGILGDDGVYTMVVLFNPIVISTDEATASSNDAVIAGDNNNFGLFLKQTGPSAVALNFDGTSDTVSEDIALNQWVMAISTHSTNNLGIAIDTLPITDTTASGATADLSGNILLGRNGDDDEFFNGQIAEIIIYDKPINDFEINTIWFYFQNFYAWDAGQPTLWGMPIDEFGGDVVETTLHFADLSMYEGMMVEFQYETGTANTAIEFSLNINTGLIADNTFWEIPEWLTVAVGDFGVVFMDFNNVVSYGVKEPATVVADLDLVSGLGFQIRDGGGATPIGGTDVTIQFGGRQHLGSAFDEGFG